MMKIFKFLEILKRVQEKSQLETDEKMEAGPLFKGILTDRHCVQGFN